MAATPLTTWKDLIDHLVDFGGASPGGETHRDARRASLAGLRELASAHRWSYYYGRGRIATSAPYQTGTIAYDHTGGSSERLVTLSDGTWPAWAAQGVIQVGDVTYEVSTRLSDTTLTLTTSSNPGDDLAGGTSYLLYRDTYPLPSDLLSIGLITLPGRDRILRFEHPSAWLERQRVNRGPAEPATYCVRGSADYLNTLGLSLFPAPDDAYAVDFVYQRRPRPLTVDEYKQGTVSVTSGSATVTGSGTVWTSRLVGTVFRVSTDNSNWPTGPAGAYPPAFHRIVTAVNSAASITLDDVASDSLSNVRYLLSDPADVEEGAMLTALLRCCELQMAIARRMRDRGEVEQAYNRALILAREADSRNFADESAGMDKWLRHRLADMPAGPDVS